MYILMYRYLMCKNFFNLGKLQSLNWPHFTWNISISLYYVIKITHGTSDFANFDRKGKKIRIYALKISGFYQNLVNKLRKNYYVRLFLFDFYRQLMLFLSFSFAKILSLFHDKLVINYHFVLALFFCKLSVSN